MIGWFNITSLLVMFQIMLKQLDKIIFSCSPCPFVSLVLVSFFLPYLEPHLLWPLVTLGLDLTVEIMARPESSN